MHQGRVGDGHLAEAAFETRVQAPHDVGIEPGRGLHEEDLLAAQTHVRLEDLGVSKQPGRPQGVLGNLQGHGHYIGGAPRDWCQANTRANQPGRRLPQCAITTMGENGFAAACRRASRQIGGMTGAPGGQGLDLEAHFGQDLLYGYHAPGGSPATRKRVEDQRSLLHCRSCRGRPQESEETACGLGRRRRVAQVLVGFGGHHPASLGAL